MSIQLIGIITVLVGLMVLYGGPRLGIIALTISTLLGSAAAIQLPAVGGASVPPSVLLLVFFAATVVSREDLRTSLTTTVAYPRPGFWFLAIVVYSVLAASFLPRIFEGIVTVYPLARIGPQNWPIILTSLVPRAANVTQPLYLVADFVCFVVTCTFAMKGGARVIALAILCTAIANLVLAAIDSLTYLAGAQSVLSIIRNANYTILDDVDVDGVHRIVGSFSEASAFAYATSGLFSFSLGLWLNGIWTRLSGLLALLLLAALLLSTSSTAYGTLAVYGGCLFVICLWTVVAGQATPRQAVYVLGAPFAVVMAIFTAMLFPPLWDMLANIFSTMITDKLQSASGVERAAWNEAGIQTFLETSGLGAGLGSSRTSSFIVAVLSNLGVIGATLYVAFFASLVLSLPRGSDATLESGIARTAAGAWATLLIAGSTMAATTDLGISFSILAALSAAPMLRALGEQRSAARMVFPLTTTEQLKAATLRR